MEYWDSSGYNEKYGHCTYEDLTCPMDYVSDNRVTGGSSKHEQKKLLIDDVSISHSFYTCSCLASSLLLQTNLLERQK